MSRGRRIRRKTHRSSGIWKKLLLWSVAGLVVLAAAGVAGTYLYVKSYLKSDSFLSMLRQSAIDDMNVTTAEIEPLEWDGSGIRCGRVTMAGNEFLGSLSAKSIETEFSRWDLLKRSFVITSANIAELQLHLLPVPFRFREKPEEEKTWVEKNILPESFRLDQGSIDSFSVSYGLPDDLYALKGSRVACTHDAASSQYRFDLRGGALTLPFSFCPGFSLMSGTVQFNHASRRIGVPSCRLSAEDGGYLDIKGDWDGKTSSWNSSIVVSDIPASSVLKGDWKKRVSGVLKGSVELHGGSAGVVHAAGLARLHDGMLTGLPVLDRLARFCDTARFRQLALHKASAQFKYGAEGWRISDIVMESEQLVRVEGWLEIGVGQKLNGRLQIGLRADGVWSSLPGFADVFSAVHEGGQNGFLWANVNIGGTLDEPTEDLSARLLTAAGSRVLESVGSGKLDVVTDVAARLLRSSVSGGGDAASGKENKEGGLPVPSVDKGVEAVLPGVQDAAGKGLKTGRDLMNGLMNL